MRFYVKLFCVEEKDDNPCFSYCTGTPCIATALDGKRINFLSTT